MPGDLVLLDVIRFSRGLYQSGTRKSIIVARTDRQSEKQRRTSGRRDSNPAVQRRRFDDNRSRHRWSDRRSG
jgi:hypothetical protein